MSNQFLIDYSGQVNVLDRHHRLVIVLPSTSPDQVHRSQSSIIGVIHDETKMIVRVEKLQARSYVSPNGSLHLDPNGSELWFYCIDPDTETILTNNHTKIIRFVNSSLALLTFLSFFFSNTLSTSQILMLWYFSITFRSILSSESMKNMIDLIAMKTNLDVSEIRPPLGMASFSSRTPANTNPFLSANLWDGFPATLVVIAALVFLMAIGGIVYLCVTWDR